MGSLAKWQAVQENTLVTEENKMNKETLNLVLDTLGLIFMLAVFTAMLWL